MAWRYATRSRGIEKLIAPSVELGAIPREWPVSKYGASEKILIELVVEVASSELHVEESCSHDYLGAGLEVVISKSRLRGYYASGAKRGGGLVDGRRVAESEYLDYKTF
jgi:hypothetical protein